MRIVTGWAAGMAMTLAVASPAAAQSSWNVFGGLNLALLDEDTRVTTGAGVTGGMIKGLGRSKLSIVGEMAATWYDEFYLVGYQGGLAYRFWEAGKNAISARGMIGTETCCVSGDVKPYFAFEPGAFYTRSLSDAMNLHLGYGLRLVNFLDQWDLEHVFTFGVGFRIGG